MVPVGKVNPVPLATCPVIPAHGVLYTRSPCGRGWDLGHLDSPSRKDLLTETDSPTPTLSSWGWQALRAAQVGVDLLPPSFLCVHSHTLSGLSNAPVCVSCSELGGPRQGEERSLRRGLVLHLFRFQLEQGFLSWDGKTHHPQILLKYTF